jgi:hypothetical protein
VTIAGVLDSPVLVLFSSVMSGSRNPESNEEKFALDVAQSEDWSLSNFVL